MNLLNVIRIAVLTALFVLPFSIKANPGSEPMAVELFGEENYEPGIIEGVFFDSDTIEVHNGDFYRTMRYGFLFSREYVFGASYNIYENPESRNVVLEFINLRVGESELEKEYESPIARVDFNEYMVDQNQGSDSDNPFFRYVTAVKFTFEDKVDYRVDVDEFNQITISFRHILLENRTEIESSENESPLGLLKNILLGAAK